MHQLELAGKSLRYERWDQRVGAFSRLPVLIRQLGADPHAMLSRAGIGSEAIARPEDRVPYHSLVTLLQEVASETACPHLGLLAGRMWYLADLGVVGEAVRHSPTVGDALKLLIAHQHLNGDGGLTFLLRRGPVVDLGYAIYQPGVRGEQMYDAALAAAVNFMRELYGPSWLPSEVFFPYAKHDDSAHHRSFFKVPPHFNAEYCALRFPVEQLDMPVAGADPQRLRAAVQLLSMCLPEDLLRQVYRAVRRLLLEEQHSGDDAAQLLSIHRRTLNRRLQESGTSFQEILDQVRFQVARELLTSEITLDDIAATLGYAAVTPFMRTFRRWSGTTPGRWRSEARRPIHPTRSERVFYHHRHSTGGRTMRTRTTWLSAVLVAFGLAAFTSGASLAQTKTTMDVRNFEVIAVDGNNLVVRDERGTNIYTVPDDFRFTVNGKPMAAKELKPGMKGQATVTTKTTINPVTITDVREATVVSTTATSMLVRGSDGMQRRFTQADLDKRGVEMIKDGKVVRISQLAPGDQLSAQIITREPPTFERAVDVKLAEAKMEPAPAKAAPAPPLATPAAPAATPAAPAATPAAAPTTVASNTPAPAAPSAAPAPPKESNSWLLWIAIFIALAVVAFLLMRKKN